MNRRAQVINRTVTIILVVLVAAVIFLFALPVKNLYASTGNEKVVQNWVWQNAVEPDAIKHLKSGKAYPPISQLEDDLVITSISELKSEATKEEIVNSIYSCGKAFYFGNQEYEFMNEWDFADDGYVFCYTCRKIEFDTNVKTSGTNLVGLYNYMETHSPYPGGKPTYGGLLNDMNPNLFKTKVPASEDIIQTTKSKYITFMATHKIEVTKADCAFQKSLGQITGDPAALAISKGLNIAGMGGRYWEVFSSNPSETYKAAILIADADALSGICNYHKYNEANQLGSCTPTYQIIQNQVTSTGSASLTNTPKDIQAAANKNLIYF